MSQCQYCSDYQPPSYGSLIAIIWCKDSCLVLTEWDNFFYSRFILYLIAIWSSLRASLTPVLSTILNCTEFYLTSCQISTMELFSRILMAGRYFLKKAPSYVSNRFLNTPSCCIVLTNFHWEQNLEVFSGTVVAYIFRGALKVVIFHLYDTFNNISKYAGIFSIVCISSQEPVRESFAKKRILKKLAKFTWSYLSGFSFLMKSHPSSRHQRSSD